MNSQMKIIQVIPNLMIGGAEIMLENLSIALAKEGSNVCVVSLYNNHTPITERLENQDIPVFYLGKKKGPDIGIIIKLYNLFKKEKPDVVHTHLYTLPYTVIASILANVPIRVHTIHSIATKEVGKFKRKINRLFYKYFGVIPVAISPEVKKSVMKDYDFSDKEVAMIFNGIDLNKCILKKDYNTKNSKVNILHIGTFKEAKNHSGLIESFKVVHDIAPNTILKLIGPNKLEKEIIDQVELLKLEDSIECLGLQSNVYSFLNEADIFVLPSLWEGMPITLIEAMATGLPIVATRVGGVPDMIEHKKTGLLVETNKEEIANTILQLVIDKNLRDKLGNAAKAASQKFTAKEMGINYLKLYSKDSLIP